MSKTIASGIDQLRCEYRVSLSSGSTKAALKQSMFNIRTNQSRALSIERSCSNVKMSFYRDLSKKTMAYTDQKSSETRLKRPVSQYLSLRPQTASRKGYGEPEMISTTEAVADDELSMKTRNPNLAPHFQRTLSGAAAGSFSRVHSAFNIRKLESATSMKRQNMANDNRASSHKQLRARDIQSAMPRKQVIIEEEHIQQQDSSSAQEEKHIKSHNSSESDQKFSEEENSQDRDKRELLTYFNSNPTKCMELVMYRLDKCQETLGVADDEIKKRREQLENDQMVMLTGKSDGTHPWEHVSIYMENEPEFNNPNYTGDYKRGALLSIEARDEDEIALLMEEAYERFDFCKKHTTMTYDNEFTFLKITQARLTYTEVSKIRQQFTSKKKGYTYVTNSAVLSTGVQSSRS